MSPTIHHKYKYFRSTVQRAKDRATVSFLPFAVWRNVKLNLSNELKDSLNIEFFKKNIRKKDLTSLLNNNNSCCNLCNSLRLPFIYLLFYRTIYTCYIFYISYFNCIYIIIISYLYIILIFVSPISCEN